jgi:hypothetical protein
MPTDYVQMLLEESLASSKEDTKIMVESIEYELEYIASCIENNHIMPVTEAKKSGEGIFQKFINLIRNIFAKFKEKVADITLDLRDWDKYINKLDDISYDGITIESAPQWLNSGDNIVQEVKKLINGFNQTKTKTPSENDDLTPSGIVKTMSVFREFNDEKLGYKVAMERVFSIGRNQPIETVKIDDSTKPSLREVCEIGRKYIQEYKDLSTKLTRLSEEIQTLLSNAERGLEVNTESYNPYLILEGAYLSNTDLILCNNGGILFEADGEQGAQNQSQNTSQNGEKKEDTNPSVKVTSDNSGSGSNSDDGPKNRKIELQKSYAKVLIDAITVAITVAERKLYVYKTIIRSVVNTAGKGDSKSVDEEVKTDKAVDTANDTKKKSKGLFRKNKK